MISSEKTLNFADLRVRYGTGRCYTISGTGRNRVTGYRTGMMCKVGDIEVSEWCQMMRDLIESSGEEMLFSQLLSFVKEAYPYCRTKSERELEALKLHASRIFDNELWVGYVKFNQLYRPEALNHAQLITVRTDCCKKPGLVTSAMLAKHGEGGTGRIYCPICGAFSRFQLIKALEAPN